MGRALSNDLRMRVLQASAEGMTARRAAARFGVGISTAIRWIARAKIGELEARPVGRRRGSSLDAQGAFILSMIEDQKDITLNEMVARLLEGQGVRIGRSALNNWLRGRGFTFKNVWPAPLASRLRQALFGRAQTYPA
jgi:transposase